MSIADADANSCAYPENHIFTSSVHPLLDQQLLVGRMLSRLGLTPSVVQRVLYFACPERVWLSRIAPHARRLLRQDMSRFREHLRDRSHSTLPVTLLLGSPGMWAVQLERLELRKKENEQDQLWLAHCGEEFALMVRLLARYGSSLRSLRVAVDLPDDPAMVAPAQGAVALLVAVLANGGLPGLKHLTLCHGGGGSSSSSASSSSFLAPLARPGAAALSKLQTLCLSLREPRVPFGHLAWLAHHGRLPNLRTFTLYGNAGASDADVAALLRALLRTPTQLLTELGLHGAAVGHETLSVLIDRLENRIAPNLTTLQFDSFVSDKADNAALCDRIEKLLSAQV